MSGDFALSQGNLNLGEKSEENEMLGKCEVVHLFSVLFMMTNDDTFLFGDLFVKMSIQLICSEINMTFFLGKVREFQKPMTVATINVFLFSFCRANSE